MLEQQRVEYLQAMGIQLWMPSRALPNAAESLWLADNKVEQSQVETAGASMQAGHAADLLVDVRPNKIAATVTKAIAQDTSVEAPTETTLVDLTVPKFELHFVASFFICFF